MGGLRTIHFSLFFSFLFSLFISFKKNVLYKDNKNNKCIIYIDELYKL